MASQESPERILQAVPDMDTAAEFSQRAGRSLLDFYGGLIEDFSRFPGRLPGSPVSIRDVRHIREYAEAMRTFTKAEELEIVLLPEVAYYRTPTDKLQISFYATDAAVKIVGEINHTKTAQILAQDRVGFRLEELCLEGEENCISAPVETNETKPVQDRLIELQQALELVQSATK